MGAEETVTPQDLAAAPQATSEVPRLPQVVCDLLYLCGCALAGRAADPTRVKRMDIPCVYALASEQGLASLSYYGVESVLGAAADVDRAWQSDRNRSIRRQMRFAAERAQVSAWLAENGIWHVPLKGAVLEGRYPRLGMREYCDNDILYDAARREDVADFFKGRGYRKNAGGHVAGVDDAYTKDPAYHFEMHRSLFSDYSMPKLAHYYEDVLSKLATDGDSPFKLRFSDEDCYVYLVAHAYKHFVTSGTGLRILCDLKVLSESVDAGFDRGYVDRQLRELEAEEFGLSLARLASCVFDADFDPSKVRPADIDVLRALSSYGTYGTMQHWADQKVEREQAQGVTAGRYVRGRILPEDAWWEAHFPFAHHHKWARPAVWVYRMVRAAVSPRRRKRFAAELKALHRTSGPEETT